MVFINFPKTSRYEVQTHNYFEKYAADLGKFAKMFRNMKVGFGDLNFGTFWLLINGNIFSFDNKMGPGNFGRKI